MQFPRNDLNDLITKLLLIYNDKEKRIEMGQNGYSRVVNDFNWVDKIKNYIEVFNKILGNSKQTN